MYLLLFLRDQIIVNILNVINFPSEVLPLALLRPISGSSSIAVATDIMKNFGVDSLIGTIASTIMGSTETTLYTIAIYTSCVKVKKTRYFFFLKVNKKVNYFFAIMPILSVKNRCLSAIHFLLFCAFLPHSFPSVS